MLIGFSLPAFPHTLQWWSRNPDYWRRYREQHPAGCDVSSTLPADENHIFQHILQGMVSKRSDQPGALLERRNCFCFAFPAEFPFEGIADRALHRGTPLAIVDPRPITPQKEALEYNAEVLANFDP
jgi:hypothetical protein